MFSRYVAVLLIVALSVGTPVQLRAQSLQDQVGVLAGQILSLSNRVNSLEKAQLDGSVQTSELLKRLLALEEANQRAALGKDPAVKSVDDTKKTSDDALKVLSQIQSAAPNSLGKASNGKPLIDEMISCAGDVAKAAKDPAATQTPEQGIALLKKCDPARVQGLLNDLSQNRAKTLQAWNDCRNTLVRGKHIFSENMPSDPTGLSSEDLEMLKGNVGQLKDLQGDALKCRDQVQQLAQDLRNMDNGAAAMAAVMNMAGTICMASGANPYVCVGAFILAFILQAFGSGKGDGDGDGKPGSGTGTSTAMGQMPGSNDTNQDDSGKAKVAALPKGGVGGSFGNDANGVLGCTVAAGPKLTCHLLANATVTTTIDPKDVVNNNQKAEKILSDALIANDASSIQVCPGAPSVAILRVVILSSPTEFVSVGVSADFNNPTKSVLDYGPGGPVPDAFSALPQKEKLAKLCSV